MYGDITNSPAVQPIYRPKHIWHLDGLEFFKSLACSDGGQLIACGGGNGVLWVLEASSGRRIKQITAHSAFRSMCWESRPSPGRSGDRHTLLCGLDSGHLFTFTIVAGNLTHYACYGIHNSSVEHLVLCNSGQTLITSTSAEIQVWRLPQGDHGSPG